MLPSGAGRKYASELISFLQKNKKIKPARDFFTKERNQRMQISSSKMELKKSRKFTPKVIILSQKR